MNDLFPITDAWERQRLAQAKANQHNKAAVFDTLAAAGITAVHADFDGEGDSGQVNEAVALINDEHTELPNVELAIQRAVWGDTEPKAGTATLAEAVERLCYGYLEEYHGGWENNDGAYGEFVFDVANRTIDLEFNGRFTDVCTDTHKL